MTSFPHCLALDSPPRFELTPSEFLNPYNFLISWPIFMKIVVKRSAFVCLSYKVHVKVCNPIPLKLHRPEGENSYYHTAIPTPNIQSNGLVFAICTN